MQEFYDELLRKIKENKIEDKDSLSKLKNQIAKKYSMSKVPKDMEILINLKNKSKKLSSLLLSKPIRTISGVAPIAIMTAAIACKHGKCTFCPGGPGSYFGDVAQSYTGNEPASRRALRNLNDAYLQVFNRLEHYALLNQPFDKVELIIMGGTFPSFDKKYQDDFVAYAFKAMNDFSEMFFKKDKFDVDKFKDFFEIQPDFKDAERTKRLHKKLFKIKGKADLKKEKLRNETSKIRCVALCIETKPDWCFEDEINQMLNLATTRVELGIQSVFNDVLKATNRGHTVEDGIKATQLMKDSFLKVGYHMMFGLPKSNAKKDISSFKEIFENENYKPDALKMYPCRIFPGTPLFELWKKGKYKALTDDEAYDLLVEAKKFVPEYCRIMRIQRDIPGTLNEAGPKKTNIRQILHEKGVKCRCIRCREPGARKISWKDVKLNIKEYEASQGKEIFLSYDDVKNDILLGFCRLRIPFKPFRKEITTKSAGIRELHVYGAAVPIGEEGLIQHKGLGLELMNKAEEIAKNKFDCNKMLVISGNGVKEYYHNKLNYKKDGVYMSKKL